MPQRPLAHFKRFARSLHKYLGLGIGAVLMLVTLTGAILVFADQFAAWLIPQRYAVTGDTVAKPLAAYAASAVTAAQGGNVMRLQMPETKGAPVIVFVRKSEGGGERRGERAPAEGAGAAAATVDTLPQHHHRDGGSNGGSGNGERAGAQGSGERRPNGERGGRQMSFIKVYLDPPTANVLDAVNPRSGILATIRAFHTNLLLQGPVGRQLVGVGGIILLLFALTGLVVWWPRIFTLATALRFRRGATLSINLHQFLGAWTALPIAAIAFTGIYLAFGQQLRPILAALAPMTPQDDRRGALLAHPQLDADAAVAAAAKDEKLQLLTIAFPNRASHTWRVEAAAPDGHERTYLVDDTTSAVMRAPAPKSGDIISDLLRRIHENQGTGMIWAVIATLCGLAPILFFVTGVLSWLGRRRRIAAIESRREAAPIPSVETALKS